MNRRWLAIMAITAAIMLLLPVFGLSVWMTMAVTQMFCIPAAMIMLGPEVRHGYFNQFRSKRDGITCAMAWMFFPAVAAYAMLVLARVAPDEEWRPLVLGAGFSFLAMWLFRSRSVLLLFRAPPRQLLVGALAGVLVYAVFAAGAAILSAMIPGFGAHVGALYGWVDQAPLWVILPLAFLIIIPGEELLWRGALLGYIPASADAVSAPPAAKPSHSWRATLRSHWRPITLSALIYGTAHLHIGGWPLSLAALTAGLVWGTLAVHTRSLLVPLVSHLVFDALMLFVLPLTTWA